MAVCGFRGRSPTRNRAGLALRESQTAQLEYTKDDEMTAHTHIGATVLGYPRIGRNRELKRALEAYWSGRADGAELDRQAAGVRQDALKTMTAAGLTSIPVNTFSWYDQMLDTARSEERRVGKVGRSRS